MIQTYPDNLVVIEHHVYDQWETPDTEDRLDFYEGISFVIPMLVYDGLSNSWPIESYESDFLARQSIETDVTIQLGGEQIAGNLYGVSARVGIEPNGRTRQMAIHFVQVLDHWPDAASYFRNTHKQTGDTKVVFLNPGEATIVEVEFELDADSLAQLDDVKIIAWAQDDKNAAPAEVHQAAKMAWPFRPLDGPCGDLDDDGNVGQFDYWLLLDAFATTAADPRFLPAADMNGDGLISWTDYSLWVGCYREANGRAFDPDYPNDNDGPTYRPAEGDAPPMSPDVDIEAPSLGARQNELPRAAVRRARS